MTPLFEKEETFELLLWNIYAIAMKLILSTNKKKEEEGEEKDKTKKLIQKSECGQYTLFAFITI